MGRQLAKNQGKLKKYKIIKKNIGKLKEIKNWVQGGGPLVPSSLALAPLASASLMRLPYSGVFRAGAPGAQHTVSTGFFEQRILR